MNRYLESGMSIAETAAMMDVSVDFVIENKNSIGVSLTWGLSFHVTGTRDRKG